MNFFYKINRKIMDTIDLGNKDFPENFKRCVPHVPGWLAPPCEFYIDSISTGQTEKYWANLIYPFGKRSAPIMGWVSKDDTFYNPESFFLEHLGEIWKTEEHTERLFFLRDKENNKTTVKLYRSVPVDKFNQVPLACFVEDVHDIGPFTYINKETNYGKYIYNISLGNIKEVARLLEEHYDEIMLAYPYLKFVNENILRVRDSQESLLWFNENKSSKIDDLMAQKEDISSFDELDSFFKRLFQKKFALEDERFKKGILPIVVKSFSYIKFF